MAKKQTFADKAKKAKAAGHHHEGEDVLQIVKVRTFNQVGGGFRVATKTVKVTENNMKEVFG